MHHPSYTFSQNESIAEYLFDSIGPKGIIRKMVVFTPTDTENIYNVGLVDVDPLTDYWDDLAVSDNGDTAEILATVFRIIIQYLEAFPERWIVFTGNSASRNRLYRIAINHSYQEIARAFILLGYRHENWEPFHSDHHYELYLIQKKVR